MQELIDTNFKVILTLYSVYSCVVLGLYFNLQQQCHNTNHQFSEKKLRKSTPMYKRYWQKIESKKNGERSEGENKATSH